MAKGVLATGVLATDGKPDMRASHHAAPSGSQWQPPSATSAIGIAVASGIGVASGIAVAISVARSHPSSSSTTAWPSGPSSTTSV